MFCNKCGETKRKVDDVLNNCGTCMRDGTANEIPKDMPPSATLEAALERKPGLSARFVPESKPATEAVEELPNPLRTEKAGRSKRAAGTKKK